MKALTLSRFDPVLGTVIFLKTPDSMSQEELDKIPSLMAIPAEGFFIHTFKTFKTGNLFIKLPSANARGRLEKFLISIIFEGDSALDLSIGKQFLVNFAHDFINIEDAYKGLDIESKGYKGDIEILNQIKNLFYSFFKTIKPAIDALEISEYKLKERVKELTCLHGLSELIDDPNNSIEDILQKTLKLIPPAWKYPENTCARIIYDDKEYKTEGFSDTKWTQMIAKEISGNILTIQVNYLEDHDFLIEEEELLNNIGSQLKMRLEQKEAEQKIRDNEEKYRTITSSAKDAIIQIDDEGLILYWNEAAEFIFGYKTEEMIGKNLHSLITPERYHDAHKKGFAHFKTTGEGAAIGQTLELGAITMEKKEIPISISVSAVKIKDKWNSIAIIRDITEQKEAEQIIKSEKKYLEDIMNNMIDGVTIVNMEGNIVSINEATVKQHGYKREEAIGKTPADLFITKEEVPKFGIAIRNLIMGKPNKQQEYVSKRKDGSRFITSVNLSLLKDLENKPKEIIAVHRDITERKKAEENLRFSEEKYRTLSKNIPGMVYRGKPDWSTEIITDSEIISGYSIEEFNSNEINWLEIIHSDDKNKVLNDSAKMSNNAMKLIQEYRIIAKDGSIHWVEDHKTSFFNKDGSLKGIDGVVYDITGRKKAEQKIKENLETTNLILEKLPVGVILIGKDKKIQAINKKALKIINYKEEDIIGKDCHDRICPAQKGNCPILDFGKSIDNSEEIILARNGDRIPILKTVIPITLRDEELLLETFSDITSLKDVEDSLNEALSDLDQIFDHTIPMYITDLDYNIIRVNKSFMNLFQVDSKYSLGKKCFNVWGGPLCNTPECSLKQILAGKEEYTYTMQKKLLNGEEISCVVRNFPYRNQENETLGVIKNFTNITDVMETERRMREAQAKLKRTEMSKILKSL